MANFLSKLFNGKEKDNQDDSDIKNDNETDSDPESKIEFYKDFHDSLTLLYENLHDVEEPKKIMHDAIQAAYDFYNAEWAGILTADSVTKMWAPAMWLSKRTGWNSETLFDEYEVFENYPRWVDSLQTGVPLIIDEIDTLEDLTDRERERYKRFNAKSVIGAPFGQRPTGFMVIKNPHRYKKNADFAMMIAFVALSTLYLDELLEGIQMTRKSEKINFQSDDNVRISLFGIPSIQTEYGSADATQYRSQQGWELITFLALTRKPVPSKQIAERLWPDDSSEKKSDAVRGIRYRFVTNLEHLKVKEIIKKSESNNGYELNRDNQVSIDVWEFEDLIKESKVTRDVLKKINLLKAAISLYHGTIYKEVSDKDWLMPYALEYDAMFEQAVMELMECYDKTGDYISMHRSVLEVIEYLPDNSNLYYWMIKALAGIGSTSVMKAELDQIENHLSKNEYEELCSRLRV